MYYRVVSQATFIWPIITFLISSDAPLDVKSDHQGIHTNNYTKSWHRTLKTHYLPPPERCRMDEVVQIFRDNVLPSYQRNLACVELGFEKQTTNKFQLRSKLLSQSYTADSLRLIGAELFKNRSHVS